MIRKPDDQFAVVDDRLHFSEHVCLRVSAAEPDSIGVVRVVHVGTHKGKLCAPHLGIVGTAQTVFEDVRLMVLFSEQVSALSDAFFDLRSKHDLFRPQRFLS